MLKERGCKDEGPQKVVLMRAPTSIHQPTSFVQDSNDEKHWEHFTVVGNKRENIFEEETGLGFVSSVC